MKKILTILLISIMSVAIALFVYVDNKIQKHVELRKTVMKENSGEYNLKLLGKYLIEYASNNDGKLPLAENWCDVLLGYSSDIK